MELTKEMQEMMERSMTEYFAAYWQKHSTPEQEAKRTAEGKTFEGAYKFTKSVVEKYRSKNNSSCVAIPDDLAYWVLMHYMESEEEGATYRTAEEIEAEAKAKAEEAKRIREEAEAKAKELSKNSLIATTAEDVIKANEEAKRMKEAEAETKAMYRKEAENAKKLEEKFEQAQMTLF